jgi:hypothetical protein
MIVAMPVELARSAVRRVRLMYREAISPYRIRRRFGPHESVMQSWMAVLRTRLRPQRMILFVPALPEPYHVAYRACIVGGIRMTDSRQASADLVHVHADATTVDTRSLLDGLDVETVNAGSTDISKKRVQNVFREVFGYDLGIDPTSYRGSAVRKSDDNCKHDGEIIQCPAEPGADGLVYQKLVETDQGNGYCLDHRVPIVGNKIPFVYLKYRPVANRFESFERADLVETGSVLTGAEIGRLLEMAEMLGIQFGEMDVLRDIEDGRIYVVDANHTPSGPPRTLADEEQRRAVDVLARAYHDLIESRQNVPIPTGTA